jgi:hypothetical protein
MRQRNAPVPYSTAALGYRQQWRLPLVQRGRQLVERPPRASSVRGTLRVARDTGVNFPDWPNGTDKRNRLTCQRKVEMSYSLQSRNVRF